MKTGRLRYEVQPRAGMLTKVVESSRAVALWGPGGPNFDCPLSRSLSHGAKTAPGRAGYRAAKLPRGEIVEILKDPGPRNVGKHGVLDYLGLELSSHKDDAPKRALPFVHPVRIMKQDEPSGDVHRVRICHVNGDGEGGRSQACGGGGFRQEEFGPRCDRLDLLHRDPERVSRGSYRTHAIEARRRSGPRTAAPPVVG